MSFLFYTIDAQLVTFDEYDDDVALTDYFVRHAKYYMTEFEKRCLRLGAARQKADQSSFAREVWESEKDQEVEDTLADGLGAYRIGITRRLLRLHEEGTIKANRCPKCRRVVRTPLARQCRWCRHDWH